MNDQDGMFAVPSTGIHAVEIETRSEWWEVYRGEGTVYLGGFKSRDEVRAEYPTAEFHSLPGPN